MRERKLEGWGELLLAAYRGRKGDVVTLLEKNADPNETDNLGRTALIHAASQGHSLVVKALIEVGTDVLYSPSTDGRTALHWAAFYGHRTCCDALQAAGGDVYEADNEGLSPQHLAMLGGADFLLFGEQESLSIDELNKAVEEDLSIEVDGDKATQEEENEEREEQGAGEEQAARAKDTVRHQASYTASKRAETGHSTSKDRPLAHSPLSGGGGRAGVKDSAILTATSKSSIKHAPASASASGGTARRERAPSKAKTAAVAISKPN